jgi:hypothetical protein
MVKDAVATMGGILPVDTFGRDAVHVAVFSAVAAVKLQPGQDIAILHQSNNDVEVAPIGTTVAIVDPFLDAAVQPGERFWAYLYPRTITALSHRWSHPALEDTTAIYASPSAKLDSERWLRNFCAVSDCPSYEVVIGAASCYVTDGDDSDEYLHFDGRDAHGEIPPEFWEHVAIVLGQEITGRKPTYFSCSC